MALAPVLGTRNGRFKKKFLGLGLKLTPPHAMEKAAPPLSLKAMVRWWLLCEIQNSRNIHFQPPPPAFGGCGPATANNTFGRDTDHCRHIMRPDHQPHVRGQHGGAQGPHLAGLADYRPAGHPHRGGQGPWRTHSKTFASNKFALCLMFFFPLVATFHFVQFVTVFSHCGKFWCIEGLVFLCCVLLDRWGLSRRHSVLRWWHSKKLFAQG